MKTYSCPFRFTVVSMASLVVPAISETITRLTPASLLISEDFPTFGFPITATFITSSSYSFWSFSGKWAYISSKTSPIPSALLADIGNGSPIPRL